MTGTAADDPPHPAEGSALRVFLAACQPRVEAALEELLPPRAGGTLAAAMHHAMFPGGKRLRPALALLAARITGGDEQRALVPAAGLECLHTYSLVHDDLPCMDDDDLRRGRPTCHVVFGEAVAVLTGDALLTLAFEAVASAGGDAVAELARAAGHAGMVGGQVADLEAEGGRGGPPGLDRVRAIHDAKTGALIAGSLVVGCLAGGGERSRLPALREYGWRLGRAFQIADDCLDLTATAADLGKRPGQDLAADKLTYPAVVGLEKAREAARRLADEAMALAPRVCSSQLDGDALDSGIALLQELAAYTVSRKA